MRKLAIFCQSPKGGVGKTTIAKCIVDAARRLRRADGTAFAVAAYDTDPANGTLAKAHGIKDAAGAYAPQANSVDPCAGVAMFDARVSPEKFVDALDGKADMVVFDLPGGYVDLREVLGDIDSLKAEFASEGYDIAVVVAISHVQAAALGVAQCILAWGDGVQLVVAKNLAFATSGEFLFFDGELSHVSGVDQLARAAGAVVMDFPALDPATFALLDAWQIPFSAAPDALNGLGSQLQGWRARRAHIRQFVARADAALANAGLLSLTGALLSGAPVPVAAVVVPAPAPAKAREVRE